MGVVINANVTIFSGSAPGPLPVWIVRYILIYMDATRSTVSVNKNVEQKLRVIN